MNKHRTPAFAIIVAVNVISAAGARAAQQPPPIHGVTGTIATEESIEQTKKGARKVLSKAADGIKHLFRLNRPSTGDAAADEALQALEEGTRVTLRYAAEGQSFTAEEIDRPGGESVKEVEGAVTAVNRADRTIAIRLADGTRRMLRFSDRAAADAGGEIVIVYYENEAGQRVTLYFKRVS